MGALRLSFALFFLSFSPAQAQWWSLIWAKPKTTTISVTSPIPPYLTSPSITSLGSSDTPGTTAWMLKEDGVTEKAPEISTLTEGSVLPPTPTPGVEIFGQSTAVPGTLSPKENAGAGSKARAQCKPLKHWKSVYYFKSIPHDVMRMGLDQGPFYRIGPKSERGSGGHLDLTELIGVPLPPSVSFTPGHEGFPAYNLGPDANIGRLTKTFVPGSFYRDFAIIVTVRPASQRGGVLFAITDARQKVVELGLALTPVRGGLQSILLYYTDEEQASHSHKAASFSVPDMTEQWTRFTVVVEQDEVRLYMDCGEAERTTFHRRPERLNFSHNSGVFVANAGGTGLDKFVGSIQQLVIKDDPRAAEEQCEDDDPYASGFTSGDDALDDRESEEEMMKNTHERKQGREQEEESVPVRAPPTEAPEVELEEFSGQQTTTEATEDMLLKDMGSKESVEVLDPEANLAHLDTQAPPLYLGKLNPGREGLKDQPEPPGPQDSKGKTDRRVKEELRDYQVLTEKLDLKERRETKELVLRAPQASLGLLDRPDHAVYRMEQMPWVLALKTWTVTLSSSGVILVYPGLQGPRVPLDPCHHPQLGASLQDMLVYPAKTDRKGNLDYQCMRIGLVALGLSSEFSSDLGSGFSSGFSSDPGFASGSGLDFGSAWGSGEGPAGKNGSPGLSGALGEKGEQGVNAGLWGQMDPQGLQGLVDHRGRGAHPVPQDPLALPDLQQPNSL
ncbi:hypothetical protein NQZ68_025156 [Dissostichus eleginoides]|nr:hypothetical protein NQZ68_025156 [Dissostichus eleginoides]